MSDLKPCPFCGAKAKEPIATQAKCSNDRCPMFYVNMHDTFWNRRAPTETTGAPSEPFFVPWSLEARKCKDAWLLANWGTEDRIPEEWLSQIVVKAFMAGVGFANDFNQGKGIPL